jgi:glycerol-3-phosphate dehydrogenase
MHLSRAETIQHLRSRQLDLTVVGAGIIGARIAFEGARLGLRVALLDGGDFGGGTSSASSKLVHGGFRYLPMGDVGLVRQSQSERQLLMERIAPNLVRPLPFLLPSYEGSSRSQATVIAGLLLYRALAGRGGRVSLLSRQSAQQFVPPLLTAGLRMCGVFEEAETIDSRLVLATVKAAAESGAMVLNHAKVSALELSKNRGGAAMVDVGADGWLEVRSRHVINAAGPWVDYVRRLDDSGAAPLVRLSKGVHLLLPLDSDWKAGVAMPLAAGRIALGIPWLGMLMLGTTDTLYTDDPSDVSVTASDMREVLDEASGFLPQYVLSPDRVRFQLAGLRALPIADGDTAASRRGHLIDVSRNGLISVAGGKLTTHRVIAWDALRRVMDSKLGTFTPDCSRLPGTGWSQRVQRCTALAPDIADHLERLYGGDAGQVLDLVATLPNGPERIHPAGPDIWAQVAYGFESEWAETVDDVARRRTTLAVRGLLTDEIAHRINGFEACRPAARRRSSCRAEDLRTANLKHGGRF